MRRRLFEGLEQGIEGSRGEHVDFVDDEYLVLADDWGILHPLDDVADVFDAGIGGCVYFIDVHGVATGNILAAVALSTGVQRVATFAV